MQYKGQQVQQDGVRTHVCFDFLFRISTPRGYQGREGFESHAHRSCAYQHPGPALRVSDHSWHTTFTTPPSRQPRKLRQSKSVTPKIESVDLSASKHAH